METLNIAEDLDWQYENENENKKLM